MTVLYFGNNPSVISDLGGATGNALNNESIGINLKTLVMDMATSHSANINDFAFEIEAARNATDGSGLYEVVSLGTADVDSSTFFGGAGPAMFDLVEQHQHTPDTGPVFEFNGSGYLVLGEGSVGNEYEY